MSSTRHAKDGAPFRQEKFCSSTEFQRGLMANLVAKRCEVLSAAADRELIWWLQALSHRDGGLDAFAAELLRLYPERNVTPAMRRFGTKAGQVYKAEQVKTAREEIGDGDDPLDGDHGFPLRGERGLYDFDERCRVPDTKSPASYPAAAFVNACRAAAEKNLSEHLMRMCLDPAVELRVCHDAQRAMSLAASDRIAGSPWYFPTLVETLRAHRQEQVEQAKAATVVTVLGRQVYDTLDYCLESRRMVLIDGIARTGKTFATKAWCQLHTGRARYVQVPSTADDIGFFRAIARSLGVSINLNSKAQQLRDRIEDVLHAGDLMLCLDEAHFLWPQSTYRDALPGRVTWIMTALVNQGVPVALVTTPQFLRSQKALVKKSCWTDEQFTGRIGHYERLPSVLCDTDLAAVARAFLPEGDARSIEFLVNYAQGSAKYLAGIESVVSRARFIAKRDDRAAATAKDIRRAIKESVMPSDEQFAKAMTETAARSHKRRTFTPAATIMQGDCNAPETHLRGTPATRVNMEFPSRDSGAALVGVEREKVALSAD